MRKTDVIIGGLYYSREERFGYRYFRLIQIQGYDNQRQDIENLGDSARQMVKLYPLDGDRRDWIRDFVSDFMNDYIPCGDWKNVKKSESKASLD